MDRALRPDAILTPGRAARFPGGTPLLEIRAHVTIGSRAEHENECRVSVATNDRTHDLTLEQKPDGRGLATNGGELLCLALATCFCNDLYREAGPRGITVDRVDVMVQSVFGAAGEPARSIAYRVYVAADAAPAAIRALVEHTDSMAEVHNTLRQGMPVTLTAVEVASRGDEGSSEAAV